MNSEAQSVYLTGPQSSVHRSLRYRNPFSNLVIGTQLTQVGEWPTNFR